ncbi:MAG TPA: histidine kinase [Acidobacteriaceae bacterium]|nr:histidine kinase [Acidobacteriaceae bacterium]
MSQPVNITRPQPWFMHPAAFLSGWVLLGTMFAVQDWMSMRLWSYQVNLRLLAEAWGMQYFIWGVLCWLGWVWMGQYIQRAKLIRLLLWLAPISVVCCLVEESIWVACFPHLPLNRPAMPYWQRFWFHLDAELVDNLVIFWCTFALFRGIGYYQQLREKEEAAAELRTQLAHAQVRALRMQLNPHFLFNTMNSISSLIRIDPAAADVMLEQLSNLLRMTLQRGEVQLIPLSDEMQFTEMYLAMQDLRFAGRVQQEISIDPGLHDALVPAMLLQPLIENAYCHGLSRIQRDGVLVIAARRQNSMLHLRVANSGVGLAPNDEEHKGVGLSNVQHRLTLHYGDNQKFSIQETAGGMVEVTMALPLSFHEPEMTALAGYGVA